MDLSHRTGYHRGARLPLIEIARYTDSAGNALVIESAHASLPEVAPWPTTRALTYGVHQARDADGRSCWVLQVCDRAGMLVRTSMDGATVTYRPAKEWSACCDHVYDTVEDALVAAGDRQAEAAEWDRLEQMMQDARRAAAGIDDNDSGGWSRAAYEAACRAAGLEPADDTVIAQRGGGLFEIPQYHRQHVAWTRLAAHRAAGLHAEQQRAEGTAAARASAAAGDGPYTRQQYETACTAAGTSPLPDADILTILDLHHGGPLQPARNALGEATAGRALGPLPDTAATLAARREQGIDAEHAHRPGAGAGAGAGSGAGPQDRRATVEQVNHIMALLARRARSGEGGGFFHGPTDRAGVESLDPSDAAAYITSLEANY